MGITYYAPGKFVLDELAKRLDGNSVFIEDGGVIVITRNSLLEDMGYERDSV